MKLLGLTGGIGMGKSTVARMFKHFGIPVYDADASVHWLYQHDKTLQRAIEQHFPGTLQGGAINRAALRAHITQHPGHLAVLNALVHPRVKYREWVWLKNQARRGAPLAVLEIPLLFETGADTRCDAVATVSAPPFLQRLRVLKRPGMDDATLATLVARQLPDAIKRRRADGIFHSGMGRAFTFRQVQRMLRRHRQKQGRVWPNRYLRNNPQPR